MTSVTFPASLKAIGDYAFQGCNLYSLILPDNLQKIGIFAFSQNYNLTDFSLPESIEEVGSNAFSSCTSLTSVIATPSKIVYAPRSLTGTYEIPEGIKTIGASAFGSSAITTVVMPNSVEIIEANAFNNCRNLQSVQFSNNLKIIGDGAFSNCSALDGLVLPNSIEQVGSSIFMGCTGISAPVYTDKYFVFMPSNVTGEYVIPNGIERIAGYAFYYANNVTGVTFPSSIRYFGKGALAYNRFEHLEIPEGVKMIPEDFCYDASSLVSLSLPNSLTKIEKGAFRNCSFLTSVEVPNKVEIIEEEAFWQCDKLSYVVIGSNVKEIGRNAFGNSSSIWINKMRFLPIIEPNTVNDNLRVTTVEYPNGAEYVYLLEYRRELYTMPRTVERSELETSLDVKISEQGFTNLYIRNISLKIPEGVSVYYAESYDNTAIYFKQLTDDIIPAGLPVLIKGEKGTYTFNAVYSTPDLPEHVLCGVNCGFKRTFDGPSYSRVYRTANDKTYYLLGTDGNEMKFYNFVTLPENQYCDYSGNIAWQPGQWPTDTPRIYHNVVYLELDGVDNPAALKIVICKDGHSFEEPVWTWSDDASSATATFVCRNGDEKKILSATASVDHHDATCSESGYDMFSVSVEFEGVTYSDNKTIITASPIPHSIVYRYNGHGSHTAYCENCDYEEEDEACSFENGICSVCAHDPGEGAIMYKEDLDDSWKIRFPVDSYSLLESSVAAINVSSEIKGLSMEYSRNFTNTAWQPLYVPFKISVEELENAGLEVAKLNNAQQIDEDEDGVVDKMQINFIRVKSGSTLPNKPYLVRASTTGVHTIEISDATIYKTSVESVDCSTTDMTFTFTGTYEGVSGTMLYNNNYYVMSGGKFCTVEDTTVGLKAFRWYMSLTPRDQYGTQFTGTRAVLMVDGHNASTDIEAVTAPVDSSADIVRVKSQIIGLKPGVYSINGQNVIVE